MFKQFLNVKHLVNSKTDKIAEISSVVRNSHNKCSFINIITNAADSIKLSSNCLR